LRPIDFIIYPMLFIGLYTAIYFIYTFLQYKKQVDEKSKSPSKFYSVSIIVPAYNEEKTILKTLRSLLSLNYPKDKLNIVVVDDGSKDNTYKVVKGANLAGVTIYKKQNGGKYTALNFALEKINTDLVGALDADSFVDKNSLMRMVHRFDDSSVMAVTPSMRIYKPRGILQRIQAMEYLMGLFLRKIFSVISSEHVTPGPFTIFRKSFFDRYGFYKKAYHTEDIEVALRIQSKGYKIQHASDAAVYTVGPDKFDVLFRQRVRWYYGFIENVIDYKHLFSRKYGILGIFILPVAFVSVFMVIIGAFIAIWRGYQGISDFVNRLIVTNFDFFSFFHFSKPDLFYFQLDSIAILSLFSLCLGLFMVLYAKKLSEEKLHLPFSYILFLIAYWFLFAMWWIVSIFYKLTGRKTKWWHKSGS